MAWFSGLVIFLCVWWTVLFTVLPFGNTFGVNKVGEAGSAPENPRMGRKFIITTVISCVIWGVIVLAIGDKAIDFQAKADAMRAMDKVEHPS
ncbi:MAG: DUF1467 family protein [Pseudomonadota bacterium]